MKRHRARVLVTGGPTRAYLDRVRFLSNVSSGALALALCRRLLRRGFEVALVSGPSAQPFDRLKLADWRPVETNREMLREVLSLCDSFEPDFAVLTAAVLDFEPAKLRSGKVSSKERSWQLTLRPTPKIVDEVAKRFPKVSRVGFKLEWERPAAKKIRGLAERTLREKGYEALCLNFLADIDGNRHPAYLLGRDGEWEQAGSKDEIASWITSYLAARSRR